MKYFFAFIWLLYSCNSIDKTDTIEEKSNISYKFYYDQELKFYTLNKYKNDSILIDTTWDYRDSLKKELLSISTIITKNKAQKINQFIYYGGQDKVDTNESYFFNINRTGDNLTFGVGSAFNDSIYLIIGEIDSNYNNVGKVDSFNIEKNKITITDKSYYKRARIGVFAKTDSGSFLGKEMYVPAKHLEDNYHKNTK